MNLISGMSRVFAEAFVAGLWQGMVLVAVVGVVLRMVPRLQASWRFGVWGATFVAAVAVPFVHLPGHAVVAESGGVRIGLGWGFAVAGCWGLLTVVRIGRLLRQGLQLRRIWRDAAPVQARKEIGKLLAEMPRQPVLCTSGAVDAPSVIGFWSPKLLIPEWQIAGLDEGEMRQIVLHECEHLRRRDDWMNLAQKVGLALFPLNPALLWADRRLSLERELACDAGVIARTRAPFDYAECLTRLAEQRLGRRSLALALSAWSRKSELVRRVHRLLRPVGSMGQAQRRLSLGVLAMVVAGGSVELARMPRLVSFADLSPESTVAATAPLEEGSPVSQGRMVPVVYREPSRMGKVVATRAVAAKHVLRSTARRNVAARRRTGLPAGRALVLPARARVMLTSAEAGVGRLEAIPTDQVRFRVVDAVATEVSGSYAALPFANGWLILQL